MFDPTYDELVNLAAPYCDSNPENDIDAQQAIYWFAANWHGGQWTNLYHVLSASKYKPGPLESGVDSESLASIIYEAFESEIG